MTKIVPIEGWDEIHGAPKDWKPDVNGECLGLPTRKIVADGILYRVSEHELSADELDAINETGRIQLWISSPQHPVCNVSIVGMDYSQPESERCPHTGLKCIPDCGGNNDGWKCKGFYTAINEWPS